MHFLQYKKRKDSVFIDIATDDYDIETSKINLQQSDVIANKVNMCFIIRGDADRDMKDKVVKLENELDLKIKALDSNKFSEIFPDLCCQLYYTNFKDPEYKCVRPNYYGNDKIYLKGNFNTMRVCSLDNPNQLIKPSLLGAGEYQFFISKDSVFGGKHGTKGFIANLQLRIREVRFRPAPSVMPDIESIMTELEQFNDAPKDSKWTKEYSATKGEAQKRNGNEFFSLVDYVDEEPDCVSHKSVDSQPAKKKRIYQRRKTD